MHISEATRKKAEAAKSYIENMYKLQHQNIQDRLERCNLTLVCQVRVCFQVPTGSRLVTVHTL